MENSRKQKTVHSIQVMRFVLASCVVICHTGYFILNTVTPKKLYFLQGGKAVYIELAVTTFIAISGFVMYFSVKKDITARKFITDRAIRILPLYYLLTIIAVILIPIIMATGVKIAGAVGVKPSELTLFLESMFFVAPSPVLHMGWSLNFEVYFYLICMLVLMFKGVNKTRTLFILTGTAMMIQLCYWQVLQPYVKNVLFFEIFFGYKSQLFSYFFIGLCIAYMYEKRWYINSIALGIASIIAGMLLGYFVVDDKTWTLYAMVYTIPTFLILYGCLCIRIRNKQVIRLSKLLGQLSYPIYLVHFFTLVGAFVLIKTTPILNYVHLYWFYLIVYIPTIILAYFLNKLDQKMTQILKSKIA